MREDVERLTDRVLNLIADGGSAGSAVDLHEVLASSLPVSVIGTLVAAMAVRTRARDLLGPLLTLPLFVPIVIGGARCIAPLLEFAHRSGPSGRWLATLGVYDLVFGLLAYALFDFLLED